MRAPRFRLGLISFFAIFLSVVSARSQVTEAEALKYVREKVGPLVDRNKVPIIRAELDRAAGLFTEILSRRVSEHSVNTSEFFLVHSETINAYVITVRAPGQTRSKNLVFVTTEMLRAWLSGTSGKAFNQRLTELVGIQAHEFGHPNDKLDLSNGGIENHYGRAASQAIELRADYEGDFLLEEAGYPTDALHNALIRLTEIVNSRRGRKSSLVSGAGTHPDDELRLSVQRSRLTGKRLIKGQRKGEPINLDDATIAQAQKELSELIDPVSKIDYVPPLNMLAAAKRLKRLLVENRLELQTAEKREALALTLWFDQELEALPKDGVHRELEARRIFAEALLSTYPKSSGSLGFKSRFEEFDLSGTGYIKRVLNRRVPNHDLKDFRPHLLRVETLAILPQADLKEVLTRDLVALQNSFLAPAQRTRNLGFGSYISALEDWASSARSVAPLELIYETWVANPMDYLRRREDSLTPLEMEADRYLEAKALLSGLSRETHASSLNRVRTAALFEPIANRARARELELKQMQSPKGSHDSVPNHVVLPNRVVEFHVEFDRLMLGGNFNILARYRFAAAKHLKNPTPWFGKTEQFAARYYHYVWENRGYFAFKEMARNFEVDWNRVTAFAAPSIDVNARNAMIRKSVIEHFRALNLKRLDSALLPRYLDQNGKVFATGPAEGQHWRPPVWYSVEVERAFRKRPENADPQAPKNPKTEIASVPKGFKNLVRSFDQYIERVFLNSTLARNKEAFKKRFSPALQQAAAEVRKTKPETDWTFADFETINVRAFKIAFDLDLLTANGSEAAWKVFEKRTLWFQETYLELIERLNLGRENRADVLTKVFLIVAENLFVVENPNYQSEDMKPFLFLRHFYFTHGWLFKTAEDKSTPLAVRVFRELVRSGKVRNLPEMMDVILETSERATRYTDLEYSEALNSLRSVYAEEIAAALKTQTDRELFETFRRYANLLHSFQYNDARTGKRQNSVVNTDHFAAHLLAIWDKANWNPKERYQSFIELTNHWISPKTDELFQRFIRPMLKENEYDITIHRLLSQNRIYSETLRLELAEKQLNKMVERKQESKGGKELSVNDLFQSLEVFERMVPNDSAERDAVLENLGWKLQLLGSRLKAFVDDPKSTNWTKHNPRWIPVASAVSNLLSDLSVTDKINLLNFVVEYKQNSGLPEWLVNRFYASIVRDINSGSRAGITKEHVDHAARETTYHTREAFQRILDSTTALQRLPFIELILGSKNFELMSRENIYDQILERHLKFDPKSDDRLHLEAYLAVAKRHERAVTLGYFLAQSQDKVQGKKGSLKAVLEAFPPVGPKIGQRGRILGIFGPQYDEELEELKDNAKRMDRSEIEAQIRSALDPVERTAKIRILEIKGSASVGVVVIAEITFPGKGPIRAALKVQRPDLESQIETNMDLGRRFIKEVAVRKNQQPSKLFLALIDAMDDQFKTETDFREEAKATVLAQKLVREIRKGLNPKNYGGWTVDVPDVLSVIEPKKTFVAYQPIDGETFKSTIKNKSISESDRVALGELAAQVSLKMFFKYGVFDPDRHVGNGMVDLKTKVFYLIDLGQLTKYKKTRNPFSIDDRLALGEFMRAFKYRNVDMMITAISRMSVDATISPELRAKTKNALLEWVARETANPSENMRVSIRELVNIIYELGHKMRGDFTFGALNGLLTLAGENYVSPERFEAILQAEVKTLLLKKAPLTLPSIVAEQAGFLRARLTGGKGPQCEALFRSTATP